jgi:hypothetical protein
LQNKECDVTNQKYDWKGLANETRHEELGLSTYTTRLKGLSLLWFGLLLQLLFWKEGEVILKSLASVGKNVGSTWVAVIRVDVFLVISYYTTNFKIP